MKTSQTCIPDTGPNGVSDSLINVTAAPIASGSGCGSSQQEATITDHVDSLTSKTGRDGRDSTYQLCKSAVKKKGKVNDSDQFADTEASDSDNCKTTIENDCEGAGQGAYQNLALLNINSNGRTAKSGARSAKVTEANTEVENTDEKTETKQVNAGQLSFEPVGLSLSSSGVQLYMLVSSENKEKLLKSAKTAARGKERKKARVSATKSQCEDPANLNPNTSWTNVDNAKDNCNPSSYNDPQRIVIQAPQIGFHPVDDPLQAEFYSSLPVAPLGSRRTFVCNSVEGKQQSPCRLKMPGKSFCGERKCTETQKWLAGPSGLFDSNEINASNNEDDMEVSSFRNETGGYRRKCTHLDSKEEHLARHSCEIAKRHSTDEFSEGSQDKRAKGHHHVEYIYSPNDQANSFYAICPNDEDNECNYFQEKGCFRSANQIKTQKMTKLVTPVITYQPVCRNMSPEPNVSDSRIMTNNGILAGGRIMTNNGILAGGRIMTEHVGSQSMNRSVAHATTSTTVINDNGYNNSGLDQDALDQFSEYAETMRRNFKEDYKSLSNLVKLFNDSVQERNNNQSSQNSQDFDQFKKPHKDNFGCSIM